jgi:hypothetical protein
MAAIRKFVCRRVVLHDVMTDERTENARLVHPLHIKFLCTDSFPRTRLLVPALSCMLSMFRCCRSLSLLVPMRWLVAVEGAYVVVALLVGGGGGQPWARMSFQ